MTEVVSSFELIFKPQSPEPPDDTGAVATVIQGYFLSISNLTDEDFLYSLNFKIVDPGDPNRTLTDNTFVIVDLPGEDNDFTRLISSNGEDFRLASGSISIPAHATALVAVLPQVFGPIPGDNTPIGSPEFEVRGYVEISLPRVFEIVDFGGNSLFLPRAQSSDQVRTLVTPQYRASYLDADGNITDQTQSTVPVGAGAGVIEVQPDPAFRPIEFDLDLERRLAPDFMNGLDDKARASALATLLGELDPDEGVKQMNKLLKAAGMKVSLKGG